MHAADLVGSTLGSVTASWEVANEKSVVPNHVWLDLSDAGLVQIVTVGSTLGLVHEEPYAPYSMGKLGRVEVETDTKSVPVENFTGAIVLGTEDLDKGFVLTFATGSVAFANIDDQLAIGLWPDEGWAARGVS